MSGCWVLCIDLDIFPPSKDFLSQHLPYGKVEAHFPAFDIATHRVQRIGAAGGASQLAGCLRTAVVTCQFADYEY